MQGDAFNQGIELLQRFGLVYDILVFERQLPEATQFVDRHPEQVFVLDHIAKPRIRDHEWEPWAAQIRKLAQRSTVYCKVSGMVTEADFADWTEAQLQPYFEIVLEAFGPDRLMFGSDWPVCLVACEYRQWADLVRHFASRLSTDEQARLFGETAREAYGL
jgi:L-fuconolactonase